MGRGFYRSRPLTNANSHYFQGENAMKRVATVSLSVVLLLLALSGAAVAQVKRVEMKIDGYLCGN